MSNLVMIVVGRGDGGDDILFFIQQLPTTRVDGSKSMHDAMSAARRCNKQKMHRRDARRYEEALSYHRDASPQPRCRTLAQR